MDELLASHRTWIQVQADEAEWQRTIDQLADGTLTLLSLWGEPSSMQMAVLDGMQVTVFSLACPDGQYPSVGAHHPAAIRLERAIRDLFGLEPVGLTDRRPWLDHGRWGMNRIRRHPTLSCRSKARRCTRFRSVPVHAGIIEPGHFRFTCDGETVVRLEERLGYAHKGVDLLMSGAKLARAAQLAGRVSGDSTVAYALCVRPRRRKRARRRSHPSARYGCGR